MFDASRDYFKIKDNSGGLFNFSGVLANSKSINNITISDNSVTVNYSDGNQYQATANVNTVADTTQITSITEKWNDSTTSQNSAMEGVLAMILSSKNNSYSHADILEYKDNEYDVPQSVTPETDETFDSIVETWEIENDDDIKIVWGVGVINKGEENEIVNRLIFPDNSQISLINF